MNADWFAGRLKELREQAGLTQQQLGEKAGLSQAGIADLEQQRRKPAWETVVALCRALGVTPEAFLQEPSAAPKPRRGRPRKTPPEGAADGEHLPMKRPPGRPRKTP
jgi:transcriptional regulator with XRE-family HTH domain